MVRSGYEVRRLRKVVQESRRMFDSVAVVTVKANFGGNYATIQNPTNDLDRGGLPGYPIHAETPA